MQALSLLTMILISMVLLSFLIGLNRVLKTVETGLYLSAVRQGPVNNRPKGLFLHLFENLI